jgi:type IV pilus assembly protein PilA
MEVEIMLIKMMNRLKKEEKGFTLIELLAVIVILAVIAAIAVPYVLGVIKKSKEDADAALFHQVYEASRLYIASEKGGTPDATVDVKTALMAKGYLDNNIVLPSTKGAISGGTLTYDNTSTSTTYGQLQSITIKSGTLTYTLPISDVIAGKGTPTSTTTSE